MNCFAIFAFLSLIKVSFPTKRFKWKEEKIIQYKELSRQTAKTVIKEAKKIQQQLNHGEARELQSVIKLFIAVHFKQLN